MPSSRYRTLLRNIIAVLSISGAACSGAAENGGPFVFDVVLNNYSNNEVKIVVDGQIISSSDQIIALGQRMFESYDDALRTPVHIETQRDGNTIESCDLYAGACRDICIPEREPASVCIFGDGRVRLNTWDCPCGGPITDWSCDGDCAVTAP